MPRTQPVEAGMSLPPQAGCSLASLPLSHSFPFCLPPSLSSPSLPLRDTFLALLADSFESILSPLLVGNDLVNGELVVIPPWVSHVRRLWKRASPARDKGPGSSGVVTAVG